MSETSSESRSVACVAARASLELIEGTADCEVNQCPVVLWRAAGSAASKEAVSLSPFSSCRVTWGVPRHTIVTPVEVVPGSVDGDAGTFEVQTLG